MMKIVLIGLWVCAVSLGSSYAAALFASKSQSASAEEAEYYDGLDYRKTGPITVPLISEEEIKGYVLAGFVYTIEGSVLAELPVPPDAYLVDEAFRTIYSTKGFDFEHPERYDLDALTQSLRASVNERFGRDLVQEVLIEQFDVISKEDVRAGL